MVKITKKAMVEEALKRYNPGKIEEAIYCEIEVILKEGNTFGDRIGSKFALISKGKKSKADRIRNGIRSLLLNRKDSSDRRFLGDTSSENIESIKISLKFK